MDLLSPGGVDYVGRCAEGGYLLCPPSEHRCVIYHNKAHYGPVSGGSTAPRSEGFEVVVVKGGYQYRGYMGGISGAGGGEGLGVTVGRRGGGRGRERELSQKG